MTTRDTLLSMLKGRTGQWVSGELLCAELDISRAAVSKHIKVLRQNGYRINALPKRGYCFSGATEKIIAREITDGLDTDVFGKADIHIFDQTDSTNIQARQLAEKGSPHGSIVIAENQIRGRGRKNRQWFSKPETAIMMSLIIRPPLPPENAPRITLAAAVAAARALKKTADIPVRIKWPNDILVSRKKLAGISTGMSTNMDEVHYVILGIGLNVAVKKTDFPEEICDIATSVLMESGRMVSRTRIIRAFLTEFEACYDSLYNKDFGPVLDEWNAFAGIIGREISVALTGSTLTGRVQGIDSNGTLIIKDQNGEIKHVFSGDVSLVER